MAVDPVKVTALVSRMMDGLQRESDYSTSELLSACLTVTRNITLAVIERAPETAPMIYGSLGVMMLACADATGAKH